MKIQQRVLGGAHMNNALGLEGVGFRPETIEIPCRDRDGLRAGSPQQRQEKAEDKERQPPQILHGMPSLGPAGRPVP